LIDFSFRLATAQWLASSNFCNQWIPTEVYWSLVISSESHFYIDHSKNRIHDKIIKLHMYQYLNIHEWNFYFLDRFQWRLLSAIEKVNFLQEWTNQTSNFVWLLQWKIAINFLELIADLFEFLSIVLRFLNVITDKLN